MRDFDGLKNAIRVFLYTINPANYYRVSHGHERRIGELERIRNTSALSPVELGERVGRLDEIVMRQGALLADCQEDINKLRKAMIDELERKKNE